MQDTQLVGNGNTSASPVNSKLKFKPLGIDYIANKVGKANAEKPTSGSVGSKKGLVLKIKKKDAKATFNSSS